MNDRNFVAAMEACTIPGQDFHHADHIRLAWLYLRDQAFTDAAVRFTTTLRNFAAANGVPEKYHETITWAYLVLIHERMHRDPSHASWDRFRAANSDLFEWKPSILQRYYTPATLGSEAARRVFILPDRAAS